MSLDISESEAIVLPEGTIYVCGSDKHSSIGFLRLNPGMALAKHNRPVEEWLVQVEGQSVVRLYDQNDSDKLVDKVLLSRGDSLRIPANQYHQHTNEEEVEALTSWHFDGDITEVIANLRKLK